MTAPLPAALSPSAILAQFPTWPSECAPLTFADDGGYVIVERETKSRWTVTVVLMDGYGPRRAVYSRRSETYEDDPTAETVFGVLSALSPFSEVR